jgi:uncharacterized protein (TIGR02246 family)
MATEDIVRKHPIRDRTVLVVAMLIISMLTFGISSMAVAQTAPRQLPFDEAGVRAAVSKRIEGRNTLNARLSAEPFADDAVWINAFGRRLVGRANIEKFFTELYTDRGFVERDIPEQPVIAEVVFLRSDVAVARVFSRSRGQRLPGGAVIAERRTHNTMTLTREPSGWEVRYEIVTDERDSAKRPQ